MKSILFVVSFLLIVGQLSAQEYYPMVGEDKEWDVMQVVLSGPYPWNTIYYTFSDKLEGDTAIGGKNYLKVYRYDPNVPAGWYYHCAIREDQDRKVYIHDYDMEALKYDFSGEVGDTITIIDFDIPLELIVVALDSVPVDDAYHRRLYLQYLYYPDFFEYWIEGVGSMLGPLESGTALYVGGWTHLLCMHQSGNLVYMNPEYNSCNMSNVSVPEMEPGRIKVYPNPAGKYLYLDIPPGREVKSIRVTGMHGQAGGCKLINGRRIDLTALVPGLYFLRIELGDGIVFERFLKH